MSCSKEALDDINAEGTTDVGQNVVARVAYTNAEYEAVLFGLERLADVAREYGPEMVDAVEKAYAKTKRELKR